MLQCSGVVYCACERLLRFNGAAGVRVPAVRWAADGWHSTSTCPRSSILAGWTVHVPPALGAQVLSHLLPLEQTLLQFSSSRSLCRQRPLASALARQVDSRAGQWLPGGAMMGSALLRGEAGTSDGH